MKAYQLLSLSMGSRAWLACSGSDEASPLYQGTAGADGASCIPGTTQACLGPGACDGVQSCNSEGNAYGACDCSGLYAEVGKDPHDRPLGLELLPSKLRHPVELTPNLDDPFSRLTSNLGPGHGTTGEHR